ncbi:MULTISPECIES: PglL family O-oligosaccharyltransferase [Acinetobacter]|uniref:PglL family O-oligosaccharyltransferase n=1 Tax=Acinetobacter TaxID=469 RepID=UPI0020771087|nr:MULTISPECIES: O-antigen ligase family protein [Acinetobacter]MDH0710415.1 Wzy polymerase domain-containing protein [Acinetobacter johnsonii]
MNKYLYISIFLFGCLAFILPNRYYPWLSAHHEFSIYFLFLLVFSILLIKKYKMFLDKKIIIVFLISCIPLVQYLFGKVYFFGDALIAFIYIFGFACVITFGFNLTQNDNKKQILKFISFIFIFSALISSYIMLKQWLIITNDSIWIIEVPHNRPFANFAQPNNCATFLILSIMATLYLFEEKILNSMTGIALSCLFLFCLALTQSRSAWVFIICFIIWWYWKSSYFHTRLNKNSVLYFISIYSLFVYILPKISTYLGIIGTSDFIERVTSGNLRIPMWNQLILALKQEPIWGYGWNQVSVAQITVFSDYPTTEWTEHSHNILLDLLIWNGIPLGLVIIIFFVYWLFVLSKLAHNTENFIALAMVGAVLSHGLLEFPLEYATFLLPIGFLIGYVYVDRGNKKLINLSRKVMIPFYSGSVILYGIIFYEYFIIENETRLVRAEILNIGNSQVNQAAPDIILMTQLRERIRYLRTPVEENISEEELLWMKKVTYRYATPNNLYKYAQVLLLNKQEEKSKHYLDILNRLYSENIEFNSLYSVRDSKAYQWKKSGH